MNATVKVFLKTDFVMKNGESMIYLIFTSQRKKRRFSLNISTLPKYWNENKRYVKAGDNQHIYKNKMIDIALKKANDIILEYSFKGKPLTLDTFKMQFLNENYNNNSFYDFVECELKTLKDKFSKETIKIYKTQVSKLKNFRKNLVFADIDVNFIKAYENYMIARLDNNPNTISKSLSFIRSILNKAIQQEIIKENPFKYFKIKRIEGDREFLTRDELNKLQELYNSNTLDKSKQNVLKYFLFSCYTGLRYQDVKDLKHKDISNELLKIKMHKTKEMVSIPLISEALSLFDKGEPLFHVFKVFANQPTNRYLKEIMKEAGIKKSISFHCGRHSFATIGLSIGIPIEVISKLLGHTDIKTTQIYARVVDELKIKEMGKWNTQEQTLL